MIRAISGDFGSLFIQARGVLKKELMQHLRSGRRLRRAIRTDTEGEQRGKIADAVSIRQRPADVEDRAIPGHWEGDLLSGSTNSQIVTLVERHSRFTSIIKVPNKETATVVAALTRQIRKLPAALRRSLTWDRGHEMAKHKDFTVATNVNVSSAILIAPGSAARTKTRTGSCGSTSRAAPICRNTLSQTSTRSLCA